MLSLWKITETIITLWQYTVVVPEKDYWDYYYTLTVYCSGAWERLLRLLLHSDSIL